MCHSHLHDKFHQPFVTIGFNSLFFLSLDLMRVSKERERERTERGREKEICLPIPTEPTSNIHFHWLYFSFSSSFRQESKRERERKRERRERKRDTPWNLKKKAINRTESQVRKNLGKKITGKKKCVISDARDTNSCHHTTILSFNQLFSWLINFSVNWFVNYSINLLIIQLIS